jgi:outer membrane protein assembly factor BamB
MRCSIMTTICRPAAVLLAALFAGTAAAQSVLTYHGDPGRSGLFVVPGLSWARARGMALDPAFAPRFSGRLDAQPLFWQPSGAAAGQLIVATENDIAAAIDAGSGKTLWTQRLGRPVPRSDLACGNIDPVGVTGTPVIDAAAQTLYLGAMAVGPAGPRHLIFALSLADGAPVPGWPVDVGAALAARGLSFNALFQNQRGALTILGGRVFVPYAGHQGDCGSYHGWVVGIGLKNPADIEVWSTTAMKGGIWAPGGIARDGAGLIFATGNTTGALRWGDGEAVFRLAPDLARSGRRQDFFAAADWRALDATDTDLGASNPVPLDVPAAQGVQPLVLQLGKDGRAYLLDRNDLGGIGGELAAPTVASNRVHASPAVYPAANGIMVAFEGRGTRCPIPVADDALTVVEIRAGAPPSLATAWCGAFSGRGAPIVTTTRGGSNPIVWILGAEGDNRLHGFRGDNGAVLFAGGGSGDQMTGLHHLQTLLAADGRLYVGADGRLYAFAF